MDYESMTVAEFDLLIRGIHRAYVQDRAAISVTGDSLFYPNAVDHKIQISGYDDYVNIRMVGGRDFKVFKPAPWFFKQKAMYKAAIEMLAAMKQSKNAHLSAEELICRYVPEAKNIIAEKVLVDDHGNKAGNSSS